MAASQLDAILDISEREVSPNIASDALELIRAANLHRPGLVLELGDTALSKHPPTTRQYWDLVEQIVRAAAECGEVEIARSFIGKVMKHFPNSVRAFALHGIFLESKGDLSGAMENYIDVVSKQPLSSLMYKRQVAVLKTEMRTTEAIALLNHYLSIYSTDPDAWAELCALCLSVGRLSHALFAANELLVQDSGNFAYHILVADVYMTCGGCENLISARKHYAASLNARRSPNLRALYGLWLSCSILLDDKLEAAEKAKCEQMLILAKEGIKAVYSSLGSPGNEAHAHVGVTLSSDIFINAKSE